MARGFFPHPTRSKYGNEKVTIDGIQFDSKLEAKRYLVLKDAESRGVISDLQCHPTYELIPKQTIQEVKHLKTKDKIVERTLFHSISFSPDFVYTKNGEIKAEDTKGSKHLVSADFPLRQKLLYYFHNIYVKIVTKATEEI